MGYSAIQSSFAAGVLAPSLHGRVDLAKYQVGLTAAHNMLIHAHGGASNRPGTMMVGETFGGAKARFIRFQFSVLQAYALVLTPNKLQIVKDGGMVVYPEGHAQAGQVVTVDSPYGAEDLDKVKYVQSADTLFLTHPKYAPRKLERHDHHVWVFEEITFAPSVQPPTSLSGSYNGTTTGDTIVIKYMVSMENDEGEESLPCEAISVTGKTGGAWEKGKIVSLDWADSPGAKRYRVYKNINGYYGYVGTSETSDFKDDNIAPDESDGPQTHENPFEGEGNYPYTATFFQQRLVYGGTNNKPNTWWASRSGYPENFGLAHPLKDDDRIMATIAAREVNDIRHLIPLGDMIIFTSGAEWEVSAGSQNDAITPTSLRVKPQSYYGCSHIPPIIVGDTALFIPQSGAGVRDLMYTLERDGYTGSDLAILANHLFEDHKIVDWAYEKDPNGIIWCVRDDGVLLGFTYKREHEVWAWHTHSTKGRFEAVVTLPGEGKDETYFIVRREINGVVKRYIEQLSPRLEGGLIENAFFVDAGLTYNGAPSKVISGLDHLEGEEVSIVGDGQMLPRQKVAGGKVTLQQAMKRVHIGIPYVSEFETLPIDLDTQTGSIQGKKKRISSVTVRFRNSVNAQIGCRRDDGGLKLDELTFRTNEPYGEPTKLFTGDKVNLTPGGWQRNGRFVIRQQDPLPITVLAVIPEVTSA